MMGKNENEVKNNRFGFGKLNTQYADVFIGNSYLNSLVSKDDNIDVGISNVNFEPGFRNNWHIHHNGFQMLVKVGIKKKANRLSYLSPVMWLRFMKG